MYIMLTTVLFAFIASAIAYYSVHLVPEGQFWIIERLENTTEFLILGFASFFPILIKSLEYLIEKSLKSIFLHKMSSLKITVK